MTTGAGFQFDGQGVVVTGGASGIGLATAQAFSRAGANVAIWDRNRDDAVRAARQLGGERNTLAVGFDQRDPVQVQQALKETTDALGVIDILVANAGVGAMSPFLDISHSQWRLMVDVNLTGSFYVCQAVARHMVESGTHGRIVANVSMAGRFNSNHTAHYCSSKAGLDMLVRCMAVELGPFGIRVNAVGPGIIDTPMTQALLADSDVASRAIDTTPAGRVGSADEVADVILFLASDGARFIDGQTVMVCGGQSVPSTPNYRPATSTL